MHPARAFTSAAYSSTESPPFVRTTTAQKLYRASQPPMQIPRTLLKSVAPIRTVIACPFQIVAVKSGSAATFAATNIAYSTGYSNAAPLGSGSSVTIDSANRMLVIHSNTIQNAVVNVKIIEWAQDTANAYKIMGITEREILVNIVSPSAAPPQTLITATSASAAYGESDIYLNTSDAVFPTSANFDSVQVQLYDGYGNTSNYVVGSSPLTSAYDAFKLHTSDSLMPGPWTLVFAYSADSSALTGMCDSKLIDTISFFVAPPPPVLVGPSDSIYASANTTYTLTNYQYVDSISYALSNATLISSAPDFSSFEIQWGPSKRSSRLHCLCLQWRHRRYRGH